MTSQVMHHALVVLHNGYGYPRCEQPGRRRNVTTDPAAVTCKRCRKILDSTGRAPGA